MADSARSAQWPLDSFRVHSEVWPHSEGRGIIVAVIDSGVRSTHQDLTGQMVGGKDLIDHRDSPTTIDHDGHGHGTAMASLIVAHGHGSGNNDGVAGLAPQAKVMPLAIDTGPNSLQEASEAIYFSVNHGARVINMSFATPSGTPTMRSAVAYAISHDTVVVAGAGNAGADSLAWPAAYPGVVSVGAVDVDGKPWVDSNYGPGLTLTAPGVDIVAAGASSDSEYRLSDGTSDAAAYVSAEAALVRAEYPRLTAGQVVNRMVKSAVNPTGRVHDDHYGYGIIRPDAALTFDIPAGPPEGPLKQLGAAGRTVGTPVAVAAEPTAGERRSGGVGDGVVGAVSGVAVVGVGGAWWAWRRRKGRGVG
nr:S8 family serine peptidase [Streptacidiphilus anmyonensis]